MSEFISGLYAGLLGILLAFSVLAVVFMVNPQSWAKVSENKLFSELANILTVFAFFTVLATGVVLLLAGDDVPLARIVIMQLLHFGYTLILLAAFRSVAGSNGFQIASLGLLTFTVFALTRNVYLLLL